MTSPSKRRRRIVRSKFYRARKKRAMRKAERTLIGRVIEFLIDRLDELDGDSDLEPEIGE